MTHASIPDERKRLILARIRRAQEAFEQTAQLLTHDAHIEVVETALVRGISEATEAEKLLAVEWTRR